MANKEYLEMLRYGEWIENYLDSALDKIINSWRYKDLFEEAVNILKLEELDQKIVHNDVFQNLELIEELIKQEKDSTIDHSDQITLSLLASSGYNTQIAMNKQEIAHMEKKIARIKKKKAKLDNVFEFLSIREKIINLSKALLDENKPWEYVFSSNLTNENYPIEFLLESYNGLVETYHLEHNKFIKKVTFPSTSFILFWMTILSRLFIGFLIFGGQEYYGFCNHCNNFFVVQRKGKKKYCCDVCRALAFKEKKSN